jgi:hypothetical protein
MVFSFLDRELELPGDCAGRHKIGSSRRAPWRAVVISHIAPHTLQLHYCGPDYIGHCLNSFLEGIRSVVISEHLSNDNDLPLRRAQLRHLGHRPRYAYYFSAFIFTIRDRCPGARCPWVRAIELTYTFVRRLV